MKILQCEKMDNPPVGETDVGDDGFNINLDQMEPNQWYSFDDEMNDTVYIMWDKTFPWNMIHVEHKKPNKHRLRNKGKQGVHDA